MMYAKMLNLGYYFNVVQPQSKVIDQDIAASYVIVGASSIVCIHHTYATNLWYKSVGDHNFVEYQTKQKQ